MGWASKRLSFHSVVVPYHLVLCMRHCCIQCSAVTAVHQSNLCLHGVRGLQHILCPGGHYYAAAAGQVSDPIGCVFLQLYAVQLLGAHSSHAFSQRCQESCLQKLQGCTDIHIHILPLVCTLPILFICMFMPCHCVAVIIHNL